MTDEVKIIRDMLGLESYSGGKLLKSLSGAEPLNPASQQVSMAMAGLVIAPTGSSPANSTSTPTPTSSLAIRPR